MQPIKTASTHERIIRNGNMTLMVVIFAALSFYDGYTSWPKKNLEQARMELPAEDQESATINEKVLAEKVKNIKRGDKRSDVDALFGPPAWVGPAGSNTDGPTGGPEKAVWFGPGGTLIVYSDARGNLLSDPEWKKGEHSDVDLYLQKVMGIVLTPVGILLLIRWFMMMLRGAVLSDKGLKLAGAPWIPYDAMLGWDTSEYKDKGRLHLRCDLGAGETSYVLDDYKLRAFPQIVREISQRKGFEDPTKKENETGNSPPADASPQTSASGTSDESNA
jgi:hypothetical protein